MLMLLQRSVLLSAGGAGLGPASAAAAASSAAACAAAACSTSGRSSSLHSFCAPGPLSGGAGHPRQPMQEQGQQQQQPWAWRGEQQRGQGQHRGCGAGAAAPPAPAPWWQQRAQQQPAAEGEAPILCGHPKDKITTHRRGNRRRIYYRKPQGLLAFCRFCQAVGGPHQQLQTGGRCSGRCMDGAPRGSYPPEYRQPC
ncbi:MAG: hypothetical protein J3K34DRAFT_169707 [Monoraphidium minutum]|nr:MAG: hypothetical protein J3K34DRAFT_169707 [Monoraphidium minutum]